MRARKIYESPDEISWPNLEYNRHGEAINNRDNSPDLGDRDAYPFWYNSGRVIVGKKSGYHGYPADEIRDGGYYPGRIWTRKKLLSFWEYPDRELFIEIIKQLESHFSKKMLEDPRWKVEIIPPLNFWRPWKNYENSGFVTELIPLKDYKGSGYRSEEDLGKKHNISPILKEPEINYGFGSEHPKYMEKRRWQMAAPIGESSIMKIVKESLTGFQRGQDPKVSIGIGIEAAVQRIKEGILWKLEKRQGKEQISFQVQKAEQYLRDGGALEKEAIRRILIEFLSGKKSAREGFGYGLPYLLDAVGLLWDPQYMFPSPNNTDSVRNVDPKKFYEFVSKYWKPNQIYSAGIQSEDGHLLKMGILKGADNLNIGGSQPFIIAASWGDAELMKILLDKCPNDPAGSTKDEERYNRDREKDLTNAPIRIAARKGHLEIVRLLMKDPRVDPSANRNFALNWSFFEGHNEVAKLLLTDKRVRDKIHHLPKTRQDQLKAFGLTESLNFKRGRNPKETMKIGKDSEELRIFRCGSCGTFTDSDGYPLRWDSPEYIRAEEIISRIGDISTEHTFCSDCHNAEMQAYREEEAHRMEEEDRWRWSQEQENDRY